MRQTVTLPWTDGGAATGFSVDDLTPVLLLGSVVLVLAVAAVRLSVRSGLPTLLIYLGIGLVLGESGFGIRYDSEQLTQVLGYTALVIILVEGGLTTRWSGIKPSVAPAALLATVGVAVSVLTVGVVARVVLGWSWEIAFLVAAVLASTDAAAVFSVLRRVPLPRNISGMLEAESGFNDAPVVLLVTALAAALAPGAEGHPWWWVVGLVGPRARRRHGGRPRGRVARGADAAGGGLGVAPPCSPSGSSPSPCWPTPPPTPSTCRASSPATSPPSSSGTCACRTVPAVVGFATAMGWIAQIGLFVLLGLLASPSNFPSVVVPALVIGTALLVLGRPLSVIASCAPFRMSWRVQAFLSWAGLRGAVPVVLATVPVTMGARGVDWIFDLVFVLVVVFTFIQAPTLPWVARRLGLASAHRPSRAGRRGDAAGGAGRRAARGRDRARVAHRGRAGVRAAPARRGQHLARRARGALVRPARERRPAHRRPAPRRRAERAARPGRAPPARGQPRGPPRRLGGRTRTRLSRVGARPSQPDAVEGTRLGRAARRCREEPGPVLAYPWHDATAIHGPTTSRSGRAEAPP